jgi:branched-chain amino acid transport system permease protein
MTVSSLLTGMRTVVGRHQNHVFAVACLVALAVPSVTDDQYLLDILIRFSLFAMLACGLNLVVAQAGLLDLGYIAFFAIGAYTTALLASPQFDLHQPLWVTTLASMAATSVFAVVIGFPTLRLRGDYLAIVTLGFGEMVRIGLNNMSSLTGGPSGILAIDAPALGPHEFGYELKDYYYLAVVMTFAVIGASAVLRRQGSGMRWAALRDDELAARSCGIRPLKSYLLVFAVGASFAGLAGSVHARVQAAVSPDSFTVDQSFLVLTIVVLAGLSGRLVPVVLAAAVMIMVPEALRAAEDYRMVVFGPLLVAAVVYRERHRNFGLGGARRGRGAATSATVVVVPGRVSNSLLVHGKGRES